MANETFGFWKWLYHLPYNSLRKLNKQTLMDISCIILFLGWIACVGCFAISGMLILENFMPFPKSVPRLHNALDDFRYTFPIWILPVLYGYYKIKLENCQRK